ncbi:hypothetical protein COV20_05845 [Candidatus Woesearchaeota archaeon CG10_big_fil_rev_8_21_14_0_10_45_16]|nr:MAG: hypothetical protein COV20_05845 [Candidatus Woesearchaeota archaeon CG10_big_fil_rev_8_21_14_0_10_45_16]
MKYAIKKRVFKAYPKLQIGFIVVQNMDNKKHYKHAKHLVQDASAYLRLTFNRETLQNHYLLKPWSVAREDLGKKARHYHTSVERLLSRSLNRQSIHAPDVLTNIIQFQSLKYIVPMSADNLEKIDKEISYDLASGKERRSILKSLHKDDIYHKDRSGILGASLDHWRNRKLKLKPSSSSAVVHVVALPPVNRKQLQQILKETEELIHAFCGGKTKTFILNKSKSSA